MSDKIQLELRDTRVYSNGEYLFTHPVIQVDQTKLPCESWIQMRDRIQPDLEEAKREEIRRMARIVKCVNCHDDLLEALKFAIHRLKAVESPVFSVRHAIDKANKAIEQAEGRS